ncbi:alanine racemase [Iamia sp. SCSIO 61187]|uniref:alanine racemase n=1 Tax=Iamia sp. SCSIO 61187 TaxID=2722752 RepID=UPI001C62EC8B|nr:alanine racemase [Iamia sp. SCSIO 61187]QYG91561.1 alanine racemase [Iamia sp. SCSIO 61187]
MDARIRPSRVEVDLEAVAANVRALRALAAPTPLWAVVKADGYGHGAVPVARAALGAGAAGLAVALVEEGQALRAAGIDARVLLLSEPPVAGARAVVEAAIEPTVYSAEVIAALAAVAADADRPQAVHLKVDTGMHRVGAAPEDVVALAAAVDRAPALRLASVWTHLAVADEPERELTAVQLRRFDEAVAAVEVAGIAVPERHAANSAGLIAHPAARLDLVRAGIAIYGIAPSPEVAGMVELRPALRLVSAVSHVKTVAAGEGVSYGLRWAPEEDTVVATVPIGYADGVRRRLGGLGAEVLVGGRRRRIAGTVTMDQILVDCGPGSAVARGDEVVLIGRQGDEEITAEDWAERLGTIGYEITCGLGPRLPRTHTGNG